MIAVAVSAAVVLAGVYLLLNGDAAFDGFAWPFVVLGVLGVVGNLALWARNRSRHDSGRPR